MSRAPRAFRIRRGFVLPLVLVLVLATTIGFLAQSSSAWRALRQARQARASARVHGALEEGLASAVATLPVESLTAKPLGTTWARTVNAFDDVAITEQWIRTAPLTAWVSMGARERRAAAPGPTARSPVVAAAPAAAQVVRVFWLRPPIWPLTATLSASGSVDLTRGGVVRGTPPPVDTTGCAAETRTSVAAVRSAMGDSLLHPLSAAMAQLRSRASPWQRAIDVGGASTWRARTIPDADSVVVGPLEWRGLLLRDGSLRFSGDIAIDGLLIVRGALDTQDAHLTVRGAVVVADPSHRPLKLGAGSAWSWDRCAVDMALATVGQPVTSPYRLWQRVTP